MAAPRETVRYGAPRRLNWVTGLMLLGVAAAAYWFWKFFPSQFDAWTVDHILKEAASQVYKVNLLGEPARTENLREIVDKAKLQIQKRVGIRDPELLVNLNIDDQKATMSAEYSVKITHPYLERVTKMHYLREKSADIKFIKWE